MLKSIFTLPAAQALFLQILSFFIAFWFACGIWAIWGIVIAPVVAALIQGACAAAFSRWRRMASWWLIIQFAFPIVVVLALSLQIPPSIFLFAFLFFLLLYWTTFRTQVPFYPSGLPVWNAIAELLPQDRAIKFIDIGSGLGGLILNLSFRFPGSQLIGIEIAPLPWLVSVLRARWTKSAGRFERGDYGRLNFADYDVVFAYLSPAATRSLWEKASTEMREGSLLLSYEFAIPDITPSIVLSSGRKDAKLYGFRM